jgi:hypothetical protein
VDKELNIKEVAIYIKDKMKKENIDIDLIEQILDYETMYMIENDFTVNK